MTLWWLELSIRHKTKHISATVLPPPPHSALEGRGALLISAPIRNFIGLSKYVKLFGVQGILGMGQLEFALCQHLMY